MKTLISILKSISYALLSTAFIAIMMSGIKSIIEPDSTIIVDLSQTYMYLIFIAICVMFIVNLLQSNTK